MQLFTNNFKTTLANAVDTVTTSITVVNAAGLPTLSGGNTALVTLESPDRLVAEIVEVTAVVGNVLTVVRGREGTAASAFGAGSYAEGRLTAGWLNSREAKLDGIETGAQVNTVTPTNTVALTNKTIDDINNNVSADRVHYKVKNMTGATLVNGTIVKVAGYEAGEDTIRVTPTTSTNDVAIGIVKGSIAQGEVGLVINTGVATGINTTGYTVGNILYQNGSGGLTHTKPATGTYQAVAVPLNAKVDGALLVEFTEPNIVNWDNRYYTETEVNNLLSSKQNTITGAASSVVTNNLNANVVVTTDASGKLTHATAISTTELGYLDGVTSAIQTQLNAKAATTHTHAIADVTGLQTALDGKQATLVPGINIKTINGESIIGLGDITVGTGVNLLASQTVFYVTQSFTATITDYNSFATYTVAISAGTASITGDTISVTLPNVTGAVTLTVNKNGKPTVFTIDVLPNYYGVTWNPSTDIYTRTGDAAGVPNSTSYAGAIQAQMKRCVLNADGTVAYYLHPTNSTLKADGTAATIDGSAGNVMVEIPKFYYKYENVAGVHSWSVAPIAAAGYTLHPAFMRGGTERNFRYYPAYQGWYNGSKLISGSGKIPTVELSRATFRTYAAANGTGWSQIDWNILTAVQLLFLTEYATFDTQAVLGNGNNIGNDYIMTTGGSNSIGNASSPATNDDTWMSYRGIENWYASMWKYIDGVNVSERQYFVNSNPATFADDVFTGDYVTTGITSAAADGFVSNLVANAKGFVASEVVGSSSTKVPDSFYQNAGNRVVVFGGAAGGELRAGGFYLASINLAASEYANVGSAVSY